jgi:Family of unknown function (DUF5681)
MKRVESRQDKYNHGRAYTVGYAKPPSASRFKPGVSGNVKGRPKGRKNLKTLIRQAMTAMITIQEGTSGRQVTKLEGVVLRQLQNALKGNDRSAMAVIKMANEMGLLDDTADASDTESNLSAADEHILKELLAHRRGVKRR